VARAQRHIAQVCLGAVIHRDAALVGLKRVQALALGRVALIDRARDPVIAVLGRLTAPLNGGVDARAVRAAVLGADVPILTLPGGLLRTLRRRTGVLL